MELNAGGFKTRFVFLVQLYTVAQRTDVIQNVYESNEKTSNLLSIISSPVCICYLVVRAGCG